MTSALLDAMRTAAASGDPDDRVAVCRALSAAEVFVPLLPREELLTVRGRDGRPVGVAFTDLDAFRNWQPEGAWASLYGHQLASILLDEGAQGMLVNLNGPFGGELDRRELDIVASGSALAVRKVADGVAHLVVEDGSAVRVHVARDHPGSLRDAAVEAAAETGGIAAIYALRLDAPGSSHLALGVAVESGVSWPDVARRLSAALQPRLAMGVDVDVVPLSDEQQQLLGSVPPLFER